MVRAYVIALYVLAATPLADAEIWTLDSCVNYAVEHNLTVRSREIDRLKGEMSVSEARSSFLPTASADASQSWSFGRGLTAENVYANRNTTNFQWGVGVQLPIFQGLERARRLQYARISLRQTLAEVAAAKDDVRLNVISQYLQVLYYGEILQSAMAQVDMSGRQLARQRELAANGKIAEIQVVEAEAQLAGDELTVAQARNDYTLALVDLAQLMQLPTVEGLEIAPIDEELTPLPTVDQVWSAALSRNNAVKADSIGLKASEQNIKVAQSGYLPRLSLNTGIGSSYYTVSGMAKESFGSQMRHNFNSYVGLSLQIPIFDAFSTRNSVRRAKAEKLASELRLDQTRSDLYQAIQRAYYQASGADSKLATAERTEQARRRAFEAMEEKYELGRANSTEYDQAKTDYFKSTIDRISARYESLLRRRILDHYMR